MTLRLVNVPTVVVERERVPERIEAVIVTAADGRIWRRIPDEWRGQADLCQAALTYELDGQTWRANCCERSAWTDGPAGLCGFHFLASLEVGQ